MSASLFTVLSKKEQVADKLRGQIRNGKLKPGAKLRNVRELAAAFSVSTKSILDAFDLLEIDGYLVREPGRGVFVRAKTLDKPLNVCLMGYNLSSQLDPYFSNLARIAIPPSLREGFSFVTRTVLRSDTNPAEKLAAELRRLEMYMDIDCVLMNAPSLRKEQIMTCLKMRAPLIFIGDFSEGTHPEIPFNQITSDNAELGRSCVERLIETGIRDFVIYSGSLEHFFNREFHKGAQQAIEAQGCVMRFVEFPKGTSTLPLEEQQGIFSEKVRFAISKGWSKYPSLNASLSQERLFEAIKAQGESPRIFAMRNCEGGTARFFDAVYENIRRVVDNPGDVRRVVVTSDQELYET